MPRQGVVQVLRRTALAAGDPLPARGAPPLTADGSERVLARPALPGRSSSGTPALDWTDLDHDPASGEVRATVRRQKNDHDGAGHVLWLIPRPDHPGLCPVAALARWRAALTALLGRDPADRPGTPLLVRLTPAGRVAPGPDGGARRLSPDAVHQIVAKAAALAGEHPSRYGSPSLRSGWITEAAGTPRRQPVRHPAGQRPRPVGVAPAVRPARQRPPPEPEPAHRPVTARRPTIGTGRCGSCPGAGYSSRLGCMPRDGRSLPG